MTKYASAMGTVIRMPPRGRYLAREAGRLAGVSGYKIGQWARRGYILSSHTPDGGAPRVYSFQDVAEAMLVHELLDVGVRHKPLLASITALRTDYGDWPLTNARETLRVLSVGEVDERVLIHRRTEADYDLGHTGWQGVIPLERLEQIRSDLRRGGWAIRDAPDIEHVEVDPDRLSGRPAVLGTRLAVEHVAELAGVEGGRDVLRDEYDLTDAEIRDAERWWELTTQYEAA